MTAQESLIIKKLATADTATGEADSGLQPRRSKRLKFMEIDNTPKSPGRRCNPRHGELKPGKSLLKLEDNNRNTTPSSSHEADNSDTNPQIGFYSWTDLLRSQKRIQTRLSTSKKKDALRVQKKQKSGSTTKQVNWDTKHLEW